jgi:quinol monooxygenase YgiN
MIAITATLLAKAGQEADFEAVAMELAAQVRAHEPGCLLYQPCRTETPRTYVFIERYADEAALQAHRKTEHFRRLGRQLGEHMDGAPQIARLQELG